jgi:hypothetical protein
MEMRFPSGLISRSDRGEGGVTVAVAATFAVVAVAVLVYVLGVAGNADDEPSIDPVLSPEAGAGAQTAPELGRTDEFEVAADAFAEVSIGVDKDTLTQTLRPALPVTTRIIDRYQLRSPETVQASCVYYEAADLGEEVRYRFCFVEDQLVEKTVVLDDEELAQR